MDTPRHPYAHLVTVPGGLPRDTLSRLKILGVGHKLAPMRFKMHFHEWKQSRNVEFPVFFFFPTYLYLELLSHLMVSVILWTAPSWGQFLGAYYQLQYLMTN